jgi:hypothetical protein
MPRQYLLSILIGVLLLPLSASADAGYDFAVDIDGTLADPAWLQPGGWRTVQAGGSEYAVVHGTEELLQFLARHGRVSLFSYAPPERNQELAEKLRLPDGRAFASAIHRLLSLHDVQYKKDAEMPSHPLLRRFGGYSDAEEHDGKDLRRIEGAVLERSLLLDDDPGYTWGGQESNIVIVNSSGHGLSDEFISRNRLVALAGIVALALDKVKNDPKLTLPEAVRQVQPLDSHRQVYEDPVIYERGLAALRRENPGFDLDLRARPKSGQLAARWGTVPARTNVVRRIATTAKARP